MRKVRQKCYASKSCFIINGILSWHGDGAVSLISEKCLEWSCEIGNLISWSKEQWDPMMTNLIKKNRICRSFSLAGWDPKHVTYSSVLCHSGSAACRQAPMHNSYRNNSLSELSSITIGINCDIISTPQSGLLSSGIGLLWHTSWSGYTTL